MKNNSLLTVIVIAALMLACNLPIGASTQQGTPDTSIASETPTTPAEAATNTTAPLPTETPTITPTPLPAETATITPTPTLSIPMVTPLDDAVNCRFGPSVNYEQVFGLAVGAYAQILAKNVDGSWWQVQSLGGQSGKCWVAGSVVMVSGDLAGIPVAPAPAAFITNVKFTVKPNSINLGPGCPGPTPVFSLKGTIYVNGPLEVKWHIETEKDGPLPEHTISFPKFGSHDISYDYVPTVLDKGNYWVHLVITSPKNMLTDVEYQIKCS